MTLNSNYTKSLGMLRLHNKTKERSPDLTGTIKIHRTLITILAKQLAEHGGGCSGGKSCGLALQSKDGPMLSVQLSERRYEPKQQQDTAEKILDLLAKDTAEGGA